MTEGTSSQSTIRFMKYLANSGYDDTWRIEGGRVFNRRCMRGLESTVKIAVEGSRFFYKLLVLFQISQHSCD